MTPTPPPAQSYDPDFFALLYEVEDRHFWFRARNRIIARLAQNITRPLPDGFRVLEVGCGTGNVLRFLAEACPRGRVVGMDLFFDGLRYARRRTPTPLVQGDMHRPPFRAEFNLIGLFDVLEHLPDDVRVLQDLYAMLAPGGALLITVPAHMALWSYFDEAAHHQRRYSLLDLRQKLRQAGYEIAYLSQYMASLYPMVWLGRRLAGRKKDQKAENLAAQELRITPGLNEILTAVLYAEGELVTRRVPLPIGTSLIGLAYKPEFSMTSARF